MEKDNPDMTWRLRAGALTKAMAQAFGPSVPTRKLSTNLPAVTKQKPNAKPKNRSKTTFLTETELTDEAKSKPVQQPQLTSGELSYEGLIREVDQLMDGLNRRDNEMDELRKRLKRCKKDIKVQSSTSENIDKSAKELETNASSIYTQIKSYSVLPRIAEESL